MRLLQVIDSLDAPGGAEQSLGSLAPRYTALGVDVDVAYLIDRPGLQSHLEEAGCQLFCLAGRGGRAGRIVRAWRLIRDRRPDLVHTTLFESDLVGRIAGFLGGTRVVSTLANSSYGTQHLEDPSLSQWKVRSAQLVDATTARLATRFHAVTLHVAEVMSRRLWIGLDRIDVIPRGRDPERLGVRTPSRRAAIRGRLGLGADDPVILAAARHEYQKGLDDLLEAFPQVLRRAPNARLLVAGRKGKLTPRMQAIVRGRGLDPFVEFLGPRTDIPDLLCAADVLVVPSRWEGIAGVLLEAMALEAPIVATDLPPLREVVEDGVTARLVPPGDHGRLAAEIAESLRDRRSARERARAARARFLAEFTIDRVADLMMSFYERAMAGRVGVPARSSPG